MEFFCSFIFDLAKLVDSLEDRQKMAPQFALAEFFIEVQSSQCRVLPLPIVFVLDAKPYLIYIPRLKIPSFSERVLGHVPDCL